MPPSVEERAADGVIADDNTVMNGLPRARSKAKAEYSVTRDMRKLSGM